MTDKVLIAGCGDTGNALGRRLLEAGYEVWGARRTIGALEAGIRPWKLDLTAAESWDRSPAEFDYVFYMPTPDSRDERAYRTIFIEGLSALLERLQEQPRPVRRLFFVSSTAVYGQSQGEWVDESSETEPSGFNGRVLLEAEATATQGAIPAAVVRFSGIYGKGSTRLLERVRSGEPYDPERWTNRIHVQDCAGVLHHLMRLQAPADCYLGSDDAPCQMREVVTWMSEKLGVEPPPSAPPTSLNKRCSNRRLRQSGYAFAYPSYRDGYAGLIERFVRDQPGR